MSRVYVVYIRVVLKMEKFKRAANFSTYEEELLVSLVATMKDVLECKKTDINSSRLKELEWQNLSEKFNANNAHPRDAQTLRRKYENIKKRTKKKYADEKVNVKGTGGGPSKHLNFTYVDESLKAILGTRVTGKRSEFDDDYDSVLDDKENKVPRTSSPLVAEGGTCEEHITIEVFDENSSVILCTDTGNYVEETEKHAVSTNQYKYDSMLNTTLPQQIESISPRPTRGETKISTKPLVEEASKNVSILSGWSDKINQVEGTGNKSEQCQVSKDWSKYDPAMLQQPRSICLMPSAIKKKISSSVTPRRIIQMPQSPQKSPTTSKSTPRKHCNTVWSDVGKVKLDLIKLQKQITMEENQRKRERDDEIHALTLQHMKEEHAVKIKIFETELMLKRK